MARYIKTDSIKDKAISASKVDLPIAKSTGLNSITFGVNCLASGENSIAEGKDSSAKGSRSHAFGIGNKIYNPNEISIGRYSKASTNSQGAYINGTTLMTIGIGTDDSNRKNALEVHQDGSFFVKDLGGYDGTNGADIDNIKTLQEVINELLQYVPYKVTTSMLGQALSISDAEKLSKLASIELNVAIYTKVCPSKELLIQLRSHDVVKNASLVEGIWVNHCGHLWNESEQDYQIDSYDILALIENGDEITLINLVL